MRVLPGRLEHGFTLLAADRHVGVHLCGDVAHVAAHYCVDVVDRRASKRRRVAIPFRL
jgi:hypothetical protein